MAVTYSPIATTTASGSSTTVTFSSISGSYTDLIIVAQATAVSGAADLYLRMNGATTGYSFTILYGTGSSAGSTRYSNEQWIGLDYYGSVGTTIGHVCVAHIMNYSNSTTYKTVLSRANNANSGVDAIVGLWRSTSAVTSISLTTGGGSNNIASGSTFTLYGIKAA